MKHTPPTTPLALDFKSATLYTVRVVLHSPDLQQLTQALDQRMREASAFFENETVVIDASAIESPIDWTALVTSLQAHKLHPVGVVASGQNLLAAQAQGLPLVDLANPAPRPVSTPAPDQDVPVVAAPKNGISQNQPSTSTATTISPEPSLPALAPAAMIINRPLRSGQRIYARDTDLIVIGMVSQGAEVIADGNIHVYGPLRGKAMAGARGDASARIFTTQLDPELLAIAGVYRVIEAKLADSLHNQAVIVHLEDDNLKLTELNK
ncbi:septum site-determining protein MinC [Alcaligenaceae bacterium]|nr:septum site-determining protein MinC [Alcaligenaceae bacterium]